ncbi:hypothetical protein [Helicobacter sp. 23-1045]
MRENLSLRDSARFVITRSHAFKGDFVAIQTQNLRYFCHSWHLFFVILRERSDRRIFIFLRFFVFAQNDKKVSPLVRRGIKGVG